MVRGDRAGVGAAVSRVAVAVVYLFIQNYSEMQTNK